jgi:hypothetical protein
MDDLIERLRANALDECDEAIDRIEALEARVAAADALAEAAGELSLSKYGLKACRVRTALATYQATKDRNL